MTSNRHYVLQLSAEKSYVTFPKALLNNLRAWTFACWIKPHAKEATGFIYSEGNPWITLGLWLDDKQQLRLAGKNVNESTRWAVLTKKPLPPVQFDKWNYIAVVFNANLDVQIYVNHNDPVSDKALPRESDPNVKQAALGLNAAFSADAAPGRNNPQPPDGLTALIAEVRIWNRACTPADVQENMNSRSPQTSNGLKNGLMASWPCSELDEDPPPNTLADATHTIGIDGTIYGSAKHWVEAGPFAPMLGNVIAVTEKNFDSIILKSGLPAVLEVFSPGCPNCRKMDKLIKALSVELKGRAIVAQLNLSEDLALFQGKLERQREADGTKKVSALPVFIFYRQGKETIRLGGPQTKDDLLENLGLAIGEKAELAAVTFVQELGGIVHIDHSLPGNPVVAVNLHESHITDDGLKKLGAFTNLRELNLEHTPQVTGTGLKSLGDLTKLTSLKLAGDNLTNAGLDTVGELRNLTGLKVAWEWSQVPGWWHHWVSEVLFKLTKLTSLSLRGDHLRDVALKEVATLKNLTTLNLDYTQVTASGLMQLAKLTSLTSLGLRGDTVTDADLKEVAKLTKLTSLGLISCNHVTDAGLKEVAKLVNLASLTLDSKKLTAVGLMELGKLTSLTSLDLSRITVDDQGLKVVAKLTKLTSLGLDCQLAMVDKGLEELAALKNLTTLKLANVNLTDAGIKYLAKLQKLTTLDICVTDVTEAGLKELRRALPNCNVVSLCQA